jgi:hypothetical protein
MSALEDARAGLADYWRDHPDPDGHCEGECGFNLSAVLEALITEHERLLSEMHQRELHHFETEQLLVRAGIDPDAEAAR